MDKLKMHSVNMVDENIKKIGELFPNCVTERVGADGKIEHAIDFDVLKQELSSVVVEGNDERYQFTWPDKKKSVLLANAPIAKTLRPCKEESVDFDNTENLYIEGDNLDVLKLLQETYLGKIKMIYIDPPYNTGNDFVYEDDFSESAEEYLANSGQFDEQGNRLVANTESNGRFHTDWLNMIYPRLKLAKNLLSDDGVIFISIDDNEQDNMKKICDEIFGVDNFVFQISWRRTDNQPNIGKIARVKEYIISYAKNINTMTFGRLPLTDKAKNEYRYEDENGLFRRAIMLDKTRGRHLYPVVTKSGKVLNGPWMKTEKEFKEMDARGEIYWTSGGDEQPYGKIYLKDSKGAIPNDFWGIEFGTNQRASLEVEKLFGKRFFDFPKPVSLISTLIRLGLSCEGVILDFFSGSATTAHAVMQLNAEDGGNRKFIMVQLPEETEEKSEAYKAGYKNICEIGKERIRRAGSKIKAELEERGMQMSLLNNAPEQKYALRREDDTSDDASYIKNPEIVNVKSTGLYDTHEFDEQNKEMANNLDIGFRVLKLDSSNMKDVYYTPDDYVPSLFDDLTDNIKKDRTPEDLLFQVMLDLGILLSSKIEETTIAGKKVFSVEDGFLMACFDKDVTDETITAIAKQKPYYFVMRDSSMASDSVAANFEQIFATYSPDTVKKVL